MYTHMRAIFTIIEHVHVCICVYACLCVNSYTYVYEHDHRCTDVYAHIYIIE